MALFSLSLLPFSFFFLSFIMLHCRTKFSDYHAVSHFDYPFPKLNDSGSLRKIRKDLSPALRG